MSIESRQLDDESYQFAFLRVLLCESDPLQKWNSFFDWLHGVSPVEVDIPRSSMSNVYLLPMMSTRFPLSYAHFDVFPRFKLKKLYFVRNFLL